MSPEEAAAKLHVACRTGNVAASRKAIAAGADLESVDGTHGTTPLGSAAMAGKTDVMRVLIEAGADIHGRSAERSPIVAAAFGRWVDAVRVLLDAGVDPNERSQHGVGVLYPAIRNQALEVIAVLVERGARIDDVNDDHVGALAVALLDTTDHIADRELFTALVKLGAHVDARPPGGRTALMEAASRGYEISARFFLANGADKNLTDQQGRTALALARDARTQHLKSPGSLNITKLDRLIALLER